MKEEKLSPGDIVGVDENGLFFPLKPGDGHHSAGVVLQTEPEVYIMSLQYGIPTGVWRVEKARRPKEPTRWQKVLAEVEGIEAPYRPSVPRFEVEEILDPRDPSESS